MQTSAAAVRIHNMALTKNAKQTTTGSQLVVDDWRLKDWVLTSLSTPSAWSTPTTSYSIVATQSAGAGTVTTNGTTTLVGSGTSFLSYVVGQRIYVTGETVRVIATITSDTNLTVTSAFSTTAGSLSYNVGIGDVIKKGLVAWDKGYQDLGVQSPVLMPDGVTTGTCAVSSVTLSATKDLICFYANQMRGGFKAGIYTMRVVDGGAGNLYWSQPNEVKATAPVDDANDQSQQFFTFPRIQVVGSEYWIIALECSLQAGVITYHLSYARSLDGYVWSDFEYLAGVSNDLDEAGIDSNGYLNISTPTAFVLADLKDGYLAVSGNNTYIISNGSNGNFVCPSTSLVGITNTSKQLDITANVVKRSLTMPTAPTIANGKYTIQNTGGVYNNSTVMVAGARLINKAGYVTASGNDLITLATELIDEKRQPVALGKNQIELTTTDYGGWLRDWKADVVWEWFSPRQAKYDIFCDLTGFSVINGGFLVDVNAVASAYAVDTLALSPDDLAYIADRRAVDTSLEIEWQITQAFADHYAMISIQGNVDGNDYYAIIYNGTNSKFELLKASPGTTAYKNVTYSSALQQSSVTSLSLATNYWMKVQQWGTRVVAWHSTDRITWTKKIDYTGVTANLGFTGLGGRSTAVLSGALGNTNGSGGAVAMDNGSGGIKYWALRIQTGAQPSYLRAINMLAGQTATPDKLNVGLVKDNGAGTAPADITIASNVLWFGSMIASQFGDPSSPSWGQITPSTLIALAASTYYWIVFYLNTPLTGAQGWSWFTDNGTYGNTMSSTGGVTWSTIASKSAAVCAVVNYDMGSAKFSSMYYTSGEEVQTLEKISKDVAAKAWVLNSHPYSFLTDANLTAGWQPSGFGKFGDFVVDADVDATSNPAEVYFRAQTNGDATTGYKVVVNNTVTMYKDNVLIQSIDSLQVVPAGTYHLQVVNWTNFIYVYVNECLAAVCFNPDLTTDGYFGVGGATFTNLRIPDMGFIKEYYTVDIEKSGQSVLEDLVGKFEQRRRYTFWLDQDGALIVGSSPRRSTVSTYSATLVDAQLVDSVRFTVSQLIPSGAYYALQWFVRELTRLGKRHFAKVDYTDAQSNIEALQLGKLVERNSLELDIQNSVTIMPADFSLQREDRATFTDPIANVSLDSIVNDITFDGEIGKSTMKVGLRSFVN